MSTTHLSGSYLVIELTNKCNLACVHCAVSEEGHAHHHQLGFIEPRLIEEVLDDLQQKGARFDSLILFWLGEPLLHPEFNDIYRMVLRSAVRYGTFGKIEVHSNAIALTDSKRATLINNASVPQVLHCSLDAATSETYLRIKGRRQLKIANDNARSILMERRAKNASWPRVVIQFIVGSNNVVEVPEFHRYWMEVGQRNGTIVSAAGHVPKGTEDCIFFRQLDCPTSELQDRENTIFREAMQREGLFIPPQNQEIEKVTSDNLKPCSGFWKSPVIDWTGNITVCTRDNELHNSVGSLKDSSFSSLWWGNKMAAQRKKVSCGNYDDLSLCQTCFIPKSLNHTSITSEEIQQHDAGAYT